MEEIVENIPPPPSSLPPRFSPKKRFKFNLPEFKKWEKGVIFCSVLIFLASLFLYFSEISLTAYLLGIEDLSKKVEVGFLLDQSAPIKRKPVGAIQFKDIATKSTLYNKDTLVTESDTRASIQLNDGSVIELGPSTMIQLSFDSTFGLGGISRAAKVDVISGSVEGKNLNSSVKIRAGGEIYDLEEQKKIKISNKKQKVAISDDSKQAALPEGFKDPWLVAAEKEMKSAPAVIYERPAPKAEFKIIYPTSGMTVVPPKESKLTKIPLQVKWTVNRPEVPVQVKLLKVDGNKIELVSSNINRLTSYERNQLMTVTGPGKYRLEIDIAQEEAFAAPVSRSIDFVVSSEIIGIKLSKPQTTNRADSSEVKLSWTPYAGTKNYVVSAYRDQEKKQIIWKKKASSTEVAFDLKSVILGKIDPRVYFDVEGASSSGLSIKSNVESIDFGFFNTEPVIPGRNEQISEGKLKKEDKRMIFTWEKKHLASAYAFELAVDPEFKQMIRRVGTRENFVLLDPLRPGSYYWRIRVAIVGIWGPISGTHVFKMTP